MIALVLVVFVSSRFINGSWFEVFDAMVSGLISHFASNHYTNLSKSPSGFRSCQHSHLAKSRYQSRPSRQTYRAIASLSPLARYSHPRWIDSTSGEGIVYAERPAVAELSFHQPDQGYWTYLDQTCVSAHDALKTLMGHKVFAECEKTWQLTLVAKLSMICFHEDRASVVKTRARLLLMHKWQMSC